LLKPEIAADHQWYNFMWSWMADHHEAKP
jgi:hypothetical protein